MVNLFKSLFKPAKPRQTVDILPQGVTLELAPGQSLLEAALANRVPYPHNCTVGTCGACKTRLKQGRVRALSDFGYTLSKAELEAGYILACQAVALDAHSVIEVADPGANQLPLKTVEGRMASVEPLTHDIMKVVVELDAPLDYLAGQYASLRTPMVAGARQYSFAEAPMRGGRSKVSFFIRKVAGGAFTEALFAGRLQGQALTLEAPHGGFYLRAGIAPMVCVAGGSGLAPLMSLLEDARKQRIRRPCVLLFGARTQADLYLLEQIGELARAWPEPFTFIPVLSDEAAGSGWSGARGRVTDHLADAFAAGTWPSAEAYMCGPPGMIDAGIERLMELGMSLEAIFYDKFTSAVPAGVAA
jgi:p-cymene monooxygenase electron transfer component